MNGLRASKFLDALAAVHEGLSDDDDLSSVVDADLRRRHILDSTAKLEGRSTKPMQNLPPAPSRGRAYLPAGGVRAPQQFSQMAPLGPMIPNSASAPRMYQYARAPLLAVQGPQYQNPSLSGMNLVGSYHHAIPMHLSQVENAARYPMVAPVAPRLTHSGTPPGFLRSATLPLPAPQKTLPHQYHHSSTSRVEKLRPVGSKDSHINRAASERIYPSDKYHGTRENYTTEVRHHELKKVGPVLTHLPPAGVKGQFIDYQPKMKPKKKDEFSWFSY